MNGKLSLYAQLLGILKSRQNDAPKRGKIHFEGVFLGGIQQLRGPILTQF